MPTARLDDRTIIEISGEEAEHFLQNLITTDLDALAEGEVRPGALLTPQGKILFDFLIFRDDNGFRLDCRIEISADLIKRLTLYKMRAKVEIAESEQSDVCVSWHGDSGASSGLTDTRFGAETVMRRYMSASQPDTSMAQWHVFRIANGVGESGQDFALGDVFPHDVLFDHNGGVSFRKGCFVGQEVVSRMQHRGTARRRLLIANSEADLPQPGTEITAGGRTIGALGSAAGKSGLAMVRIDRAAQAMAEGTAIEADGITLSLTIPVWAGFEFPDTTSSAESG